MLRASSFRMKQKVAVILSGCGVSDGSEIHEAASCLIHLSLKGYDVTCFAPNDNQDHVWDHQAAHKSKDETRHMMKESARIARGPVHDISALKGENFDALVIPGGSGVMKNLTTFAKDEAKGVVRDDVERAIRSFAGKPIGACCVAPVMMAKIFQRGTMTMGSPVGQQQDLAKSFGAKMAYCLKEESVVDQEHKVFSCPAYMAEDATPGSVYKCIGDMIGKIDSHLDKAREKKRREIARQVDKEMKLEEKTAGKFTSSSSSSKIDNKKDYGRDGNDKKFDSSRDNRDKKVEKKSDDNRDKTYDSSDKKIEKKSDDNRDNREKTFEKKMDDNRDKQAAKKSDDDKLKKQSDKKEDAQSGTYKPQENKADNKKPKAKAAAGGTKRRFKKKAAKKLGKKKVKKSKKAAKKQ